VCHRFDFLHHEVRAENVVLPVDNFALTKRFSFEFYDICMGELVSKRLPMTIAREPQEIEDPIKRTERRKKETKCQRPCARGVTIDADDSDFTEAVSESANPGTLENDGVAKNKHG